ncbi:acid protease [Saccharata proteae CBS 121410]|uniref:Acid protease n=1 Tax=Saccharata proteae CBS 121410 TaxID=1314787 RepID=A0A6A5YF97_9PEZI|nr:acid protease [Saccharata proteae CBS 121410]
MDKAILGLALVQSASAQGTVSLPLAYKYGTASTQILTEISLGTPAGTTLDIVADTGSANFWIFGPNATVNYGSTFLGEQGPCNQTAIPYYNNSASTSATDPATFSSIIYSYGGNSKQITVDQSVNDTLHASFPATTEDIPDVRVAVSEYALYRQGDDGSCTGITHETGIMGLSPHVNSTEGPSFRQDLFDTGKIGAEILSMWFERNDGPINATLRGTALFGAVDDTKYTGELVRVPRVGSQSAYYVNTPAVVLNGNSVQLDNETTECLVDSGSLDDTLPYTNETEFLAKSGLVLSNGYVSYPSPCEDIPADKTIDYTFKGAEAGEAVTVQIPLRNYARGAGAIFNDTQNCPLQISQGFDSCTLAAAFFTGAFFAVDDAAGSLSLAQGGLPGSFAEY